MDIVAAADVNSAVAYVIALIVEAKYVAGFKLVKLNMHAVVCLGGGCAVEAAAKLGIDIPDKAGAVKAFFGAFCAVLVVIAHKLAGKVGNFLSRAFFSGS